MSDQNKEMLDEAARQMARTQLLLTMGQALQQTPYSQWSIEKHAAMQIVLGEFEEMAKSQIRGISAIVRMDFNRSESVDSFIDAMNAND